MPGDGKQNRKEHLRIGSSSCAALIKHNNKRARASRRVSKDGFCFLYEKAFQGIKTGHMIHTCGAAGGLTVEGGSGLHFAAL